MKKFLFACCLPLAFLSCGDDDSENGLTCSEATENTVTAASNYANANSDDYETFCNAYKIALQQQIDACGDTSGVIQDIIDGLEDCTLEVISN